MSLMTDDVINFTSMLRMSYDFLHSGRKFNIKSNRKGKKLISVVFPFSDLVFAAKAIPIFPIRLEKFKVNTYLEALNSASGLFGWKAVSNFLGFIRKFDFLKVFDGIIDDVINSLNYKYNKMYDLGIEEGVSNDFCYGIKALYGMHSSRQNNLDANLNVIIRCSAFNKYYESLKRFNDNLIWLDIPPRNIGNALEICTENVKDTISQLEKLTGNSITDNDLRKQFRISNECRELYREIIYEISNSDFYPCNPATFSEILALLSISFQDFNSNAETYLKNFRNLVKEMKERIRKKIGMDVSNRPRILLTPRFGGWEPESHNLIYKMGGRLLYADWEILGALENIEVYAYSDPIEAYAKFLMDITTKGIGCDNNALTDSYIRVARKMDVDGLIFIELFGCHSISNCYTMLRQKVRKELEIPTTALTFNKIGENIEQVKTRLGAFMEMFN